MFFADVQAHTWQDVALAAISALSATAAAYLAIRNGQKIDRNHDWSVRNNGHVGGKGDIKKVKTRPKKNGQHPDWYHPPDLK